jgi:hypothetical protein
MKTETHILQFPRLSEKIFIVEITEHSDRIVFDERFPKLYGPDEDWIVFALCGWQGSLRERYKNDPRPIGTKMSWPIEEDYNGF